VSVSAYVLTVSARSALNAGTAQSTTRTKLVMKLIMQASSINVGITIAPGKFRHGCAKGNRAEDQ
jgi:hypothetical protein